MSLHFFLLLLFLLNFSLQAFVKLQDSLLLFLFCSYAGFIYVFEFNFRPTPIIFLKSKKFCFVRKNQFLKQAVCVGLPE